MPSPTWPPTDESHEAFRAELREGYWSALAVALHYQNSGFSAFLPALDEAPTHEVRAAYTDPFDLLIWRPNSLDVLRVEVTGRPKTVFGSLAAYPHQDVIVQAVATAAKWDLRPSIVWNVSGDLAGGIWLNLPSYPGQIVKKRKFDRTRGVERDFWVTPKGAWGAWAYTSLPAFSRDGVNPYRNAWLSAL